jgi:leader peptidase (prepilin peptidase)/N-methyltransferase
MQKVWWLDMESGIIVVMLIIYTVQDIKNKRIKTRYLPIFALLGLLIQVIKKEINIISIIGGSSIGLVILLLSYISRGSIGLGDGMVLAITGIYLGLIKNGELLTISLLYTSLCALGCIVIGKKGKKYELPFIPFLLAGFLTMLGKEVIG